MVSVSDLSPLDWPVADLLSSLRSGETPVTAIAEAVIKREKLLRSTRAFTFFDAEDVRRRAKALDRLGPPRIRGERPLHGLPVSVKDLFDVRGMPTGCGSSFYSGTRPVPAQDGSEVAHWRSAGALLVGKTHLNEFAYGLTGENLHLGPCLQPTDHRLLTGGSSSGAAATVQGGVAAVGLGTDTGGSLRVPAAYSGLVAWRRSTSGGVHRGMFPLAPSFDSTGWLQRDLRDVARIWEAREGEILPTRARPGRWRIAFLSGPWLDVCEPEIQQAYQSLERAFADWRGAAIFRLSNPFLGEALDLFIPMQAFEAARIHRRFLQKFAGSYDPRIRERLEWGAALTPKIYEGLKSKRTMFCRRMRSLWVDADLLVAPAVPFRSLPANENLDSRRNAMLRLTTPFSLAGLPALVVPWKQAGIPFACQILAPKGGDRDLAEFSRHLASWLAPDQR